MADFEKNHPGIAAQELWKLFLCKVEEQNLGSEFTSAVEKVCAIGLDLSKYIVRFFPTFTLHDGTHTANVCRWMWVLLGERREQLTAHEAALLLMEACCHDIGMSVSPDQEKRMRRRDYPGWDEYFRRNLRDDEKYEETKVISDRMLRNFVRMHHHERVGENLRQTDWPKALTMKGITRDVLLKLCRSHGTSLNRTELRDEEGKYDLLLCAVLLRLADLLDYDTSRASEVLFRHIGLDQPQDTEEERSAQEYEKNQAGTFDDKIANGVLRYYAEYKNPQQEQNVQSYLDWVEQELKCCSEELRQTASHWKLLTLPYKIDAEKVTRLGYTAGKFCMTMDQDKVLDLLTGENLYSDAGVFVRELLQNSIDAVLMRAKQDPAFRLEDGLIQIDTWMDEEANTWFRIRDNGTGMNEHIIQNHFLKVGNSYYTSEEFQYANRHAHKGSYTAISRFGIGILSCFMGDKEHTQLKVSTKRFGEGPKNGIRLDVTGLHGYYFLCNEKDHPEYEDWFPKMPSQDGNDQGYRTEPGTTICVNTNLLRMGELRSIREILDKYVQFPEVRVTYNGSDGYKEYPTQQELMDAVYALNPDGVEKAYVHEVPDKAFAEIRRIVEDETIGRPKLVFRYGAIEWLSDSKKLTGISISINIRNGIKDVQMFVGRAGHKTVTIGMESIGAYDHEGWSASLDIEVTGEHGILSPQEQKLWDYCFEDAPDTFYSDCRITYAGVSVTSKTLAPDIFGAEDISILILREDFLPQVDLARDKISALPLEAACCMDHISPWWGGRSIPEFRENRNYLLATEQEVQEILDLHPMWKKCLEYKTLISLDDVLDAGYPGTMLQVAAWKKNHSVRLIWKEDEEGRGKVILEKTQEESDNKTADFPVLMFVSMDMEYMEYRGVVFYNRTAPLSQWLIEKREVLKQRVPDMYSQLIRNMVLGSAKKSIAQVVNAILSYLRNFDHNTFDIHDDLYLT